MFTAHDTLLYFAFSSEEAVVESMRRCIDNLRQWKVHEHLKLINDRTEFVLIVTKQQLA